MQERDLQIIEAKRPNDPDVTRLIRHVRRLQSTLLEQSRELGALDNKKTSNRS